MTEDLDSDNLHLLVEKQHGESKENIRAYCIFCGISIGTGSFTNTMCDGINHDGPFIEVCVKCVRLSFPIRKSCVCGWDLLSCYMAPETQKTYLAIGRSLFPSSKTSLAEKREYPPIIMTQEILLEHGCFALAEAVRKGMKITLTYSSDEVDSSDED